METRTTHELLTILRDNAKVDQTGLIIRAGLCYEVGPLNTKELINDDEYSLLRHYIKVNMPKYTIPVDTKIIDYDDNFNIIDHYDDFSQTGFGWLPTSWKPRLRWLNKHIKLTLKNAV